MGQAHLATLILAGRAFHCPGGSSGSFPGWLQVLKEQGSPPDMDIFCNKDTEIYELSALFHFLVFLSTMVVNAAKFDIINNCQETIWAAHLIPNGASGGKALNKGEVLTINSLPGNPKGRIWGRTKCNFDANGQGKCETGDCDGQLECKGGGSPPNTLAEYALQQFQNQDFFDMSIIDGFSIPMEFSSTSASCNHVIKCTGDVVGQCPNELKVPGGCQGPCWVFKNEEHCCISGNCGPTNFSRYFKEKCPDVYSYPTDDATSLFTCPTGTDYKVVFCPDCYGLFWVWVR